MIYHITSKKAWEEAKQQGLYRTESLDNEGFIHCSSKNQVVLVGNFLYKGQKDMTLLEIDEKKVKPKVVFEDLKGHGTFPHIYGPLNTNAVAKVHNFNTDNKGSFLLPEEIR